MRIEYSKKFIKEFKKCPSAIKNTFAKKLEVFINNKYHPALNNHSLFGELKNYKSLNITGNWRAIFQELDNEIIYFVAVGTHSQLYS